MAKYTLWHNPRCAKSREGFKILEGLDVEIRRYLENPPDCRELREILKKLGMKPTELVRKKEKLFRELGLKDASEEEILKAMCTHPKLIERPILIKGEKAVLGRPPERFLELIDENS